METESMKENDKQQQNSTNIRRYYCEYCGIGRSKKYLLRSHILLQHKDELKEVKLDEVGPFKPASQKVLHACEECSATFWKPAHLEQHMRCHSVEYQDGEPPEKLHHESLCLRTISLERPFTCPVVDCYYSYRRKDHLNRHLLKHNGNIFDCPFQSCNRTFVFQGNMRRHVNQYHYDLGDDKDDDGDVNDNDDDAIDVDANDDDDEEEDANDEEDDANDDVDDGDADANDDVADGDADANNFSCKDEKQHVCNEPGCGKSFKYASKLKKHEGSHLRVEYLEFFCGEPQCMKPFTNKKCLQAHIQSCHRYVKCEVCGSQQLKKHIKRHWRSHEAPDRIECTFPGCPQVFSNKSNLYKHVRAVHEDLRPYRCGSTGCVKKFPYKHVRDNHERTHAYQQGDFLEADEEWRSRPRGGQKKRPITAEMLMRKRVVPMGTDNLPPTSIVRDDGAQYLRWLLSDSCSC